MTNAITSWVVRFAGKGTLLGGLSVVLPAGMLLAQTNPPVPLPAPAIPPASAAAVANGLRSRGSEVIPPVPTPSAINQPERPGRRGGPGQGSPPSESVKALVADFQKARQSFQDQQQKLLRQLQQATAEQRAAIREQLKENLQEWLRQQREHIRDLREQARDIRDRLPDLREVVDSAKEGARGR